MMPRLRLKARAVTSSHPPHRISEARTASVRRARRVKANPARSRMSTAGMSQEAWPPELAVEQPQQSRGTPAASGDAATAHAAGLIAGEAPEAVVAEREVPQAVVLRPTDVRAAGRGDEHHGDDPPHCRRNHGGR